MLRELTVTHCRFPLVAPFRIARGVKHAAGDDARIFAVAICGEQQIEACQGEGRPGGNPTQELNRLAYAAQIHRRFSPDSVVCTLGYFSFYRAIHLENELDLAGHSLPLVAMFPLEAWPSLVLGSTTDVHARVEVSQCARSS